MKSKSNFGWLYLALASTTWSFNCIIVKSIPWNGLTIAVLSGLLGAAFAVIVTKSPRFKVTWVKVLGAVCYLGQGIFYTYALKMTTAGNAVVLQNSSIICIILLNYILLKQKPSKAEVFVCLLLLGGVTLAFGDQIQLTASIGNLFAVLSGFFYGGVFVTGRLPGGNPTQSYILSKVCFLFLFPVIFTDVSFRTHQTLPAWVFVALMGIVISSGGWLLFAKGLKTTPSLTANFIVMIEPVLAPILAFLILKESLGPFSLLGAVVIMATLAVYNWTNMKKSARQKELP